MKAWQLKKRMQFVSNQLSETAKNESRLDWNCLNDSERHLFNKVQEITEKYAPAMPPKDVIEKNADLWYKGLEIFEKCATELFVKVVPASFCCDELETRYFKLYF